LNILLVDGLVYGKIHTGWVIFAGGGFYSQPTAATTLALASPLLTSLIWL